MIQKLWSYGETCLVSKVPKGGRRGERIGEKKERRERKRRRGERRREEGGGRDIVSARNLLFF